MEEDSFCIFLVFMKASKFSGLEERAELVASQLTQVIYFYATSMLLIFLYFFVVRRSVVENSVYLDFITP